MVKRRLKKRDWTSISMVRKTIGKKKRWELIAWLEGARKLEHSPIKEHVIAMLEKAIRARKV